MIKEDMNTNETHARLYVNLAKAIYELAAKESNVIQLERLKQVASSTARLLDNVTIVHPDLGDSILEFILFRLGDVKENESAKPSASTKFYAKVVGDMLDAAESQ